MRLKILTDVVSLLRRDVSQNFSVSTNPAEITPTCLLQFTQHQTVHLVGHSTRAHIWILIWSLIIFAIPSQDRDLIFYVAHFTVKCLTHCFSCLNSFRQMLSFSTHLLVFIFKRYLTLTLFISLCKYVLVNYRKHTNLEVSPKPSVWKLTLAYRDCSSAISESMTWELFSLDLKSSCFLIFPLWPLNLSLWGLFVP